MNTSCSLMILYCMYYLKDAINNFMIIYTKCLKIVGLLKINYKDIYKEITTKSTIFFNKIKLNNLS